MGGRKKPKHLIYTMLKISVTTWHTGLLHDYHYDYMIIFRFQAKDYDKRKFSALMICACFIDKLSKKDETHVYTSKLS